MATTINTQWAIERGSQSNPLYQIASAAATDINALQAADTAIQSAATTLSGRVTVVEAITQKIAKHTTFAGSTNTSITLLKANLAGAANVICDITSTAAGPITATVDTAANIISQITSPFAGQTYLLRIMNGHATEVVTVATATGVTLSGTMTIAALSYRNFLVTLNTLSTITIKNIGGGLGTI